MLLPDPPHIATLTSAMHELPVTQEILSIVLRHAAGSVTRIVSITLEVSELSDLQPVWIERYFRHIARGTPAEQAKIIVNQLPVRAECSSCGREFTADVRKKSGSGCPDCGCDRFRILSAGEFRVKEMEAL